VSAGEDVTLVGEPGEQTDEGHSANDGGEERELRRGTTLGRYVILERIGAGAMGAVYAAYDPELDRRVAIKLVHVRAGGTSGGSEGSGRLQREAQAMARLSHPNVIVVHDVGTFESEVFIAMEFVDGGTLGEWMAGASRSWQEVLETFRLAGAGLAAAHAAGIVHRDFKPENVLLGKDGRVRVMDFGLARPVGEGSSLEETVPDELLAQTGSSSLDVRLTRTGALVGTPAYMAPEQHEGNVASALSDQFSFCVALYEGLYGQRPFKADNLAALAFQVMRGKVQPPPADTQVPRWVHEQVLRGLSTEAEDRHPSMDALLAALTPAPSRPRRNWLAAGGILAVVATGSAAAAVASGANEGVCEAGADRVAATWNDDARARVESAFSATGKAYADSAWQNTRAQIDAYADAWLASYVDACEATHVRGEQSASLLDRRMVCLDRRMTELSTLVGLLAEADADAVARASDLAGGLSPLSTCSDVERLLAEVEPPRPEIADAVAQARAVLDEVKVLRDAGRFETAQARLADVGRQTEGLDYGPLEVERAYLDGAVAWDLGELEEAEQSLQRSAVEAARLHMDAAEADAWSALLSVVALNQRKYDEGDRIAWAATAAIARLGDPPIKRGRLLTSQGTVAFLREQNDEAEAMLREAVDLGTAHLGPEHDQTLHALDMLALVHHARGEYDEAQSLFEREIEARERTLGPLHPSLGSPLANLARVYAARKQPADAERLYERALTVFEGAHGPKHPAVGTIRHNLSNALRAQDKLDEAKAQLDAAMEIEIEIYGADSDLVAGNHNGLGVLELARGEHQAALEHFGIALEGWRNAYGEGHHKLAYPLTGQGRALVGLGREAEAIAPLERALEIRDAPEHAEEGKVPADETARTCFTLAQAVWARGDRSRARTLAERALGLLQPIEGLQPFRDEIDAWLVAHA
jgi:tetratricopeptide (TPR) repeat protein